MDYKNPFLNGALCTNLSCSGYRCYHKRLFNGHNAHTGHARDSRCLYNWVSNLPTLYQNKMLHKAAISSLLGMCIGMKIFPQYNLVCLFSIRWIMETNRKVLLIGGGRQDILVRWWPIIYWLIVGTFDALIGWFMKTKPVFPFTWGAHATNSFMATWPFPHNWALPLRELVMLWY